MVKRVILQRVRTFLVPTSWRWKNAFDKGIKLLFNILKLQRKGANRTAPLPFEMRQGGYSREPGPFLEKRMIQFEVLLNVPTPSNHCPPHMLLVDEPAMKGEVNDCLLWQAGKLWGWMTSEK
ncbi:unnamed protein product, partial [Choristocarpus tenellus]